MAGIENIVVHSKVGVDRRVCLAEGSFSMCQLLISLLTELPRPLDPSPRTTFDLMERSASQEEH